VTDHNWEDSVGFSYLIYVHECVIQANL